MHGEPGFPAGEFRSDLSAGFAVRILQEAIMFDLLEKIVLTGLGAMSLSQKKAEEMLAELKDKYKLSEEEGRNFLEKAQTMAKEGKERLSEAADAEVKKVLDRIGLVSREEFDRLQKRLEELEERIKNS
jgi:polyhydroxyalkanoate synthesis regulator phasin